MPTRRRLAAELKELNRPDVPASFINWLVKRLLTGRRLSEDNASAWIDRLSRKRRREVTIAGVYHRMYAALDGSEEVEVADIGLVRVPKEAGPPSDQALEMTATFLRQGKFAPPSNRSMLNIVTKNSRKKK